jgi:hypothetical protein
MMTIGEIQGPMSIDEGTDGRFYRHSSAILGRIVLVHGILATT